jgi:hypothetical protein
MMSQTSKLRGIFFEIQGHAGQFTIARQPSYEYWQKLHGMYEIAKRYDLTIELSIAFCIEYHETQIQTMWSNNRIFPKKVIVVITIPPNVRKFFQIVSVKKLLDDFRRLDSNEMKTKQKLMEAKEKLLSSFKGLYPPTINVLTSADFSRYLETLDSDKRAIESCDEWKNFRQFDLLWHKVMPVLFGWMMTGMVKTSLTFLSKSRLLKPTQLLSFHDLFGKLPKDMQKLYVQHRFWMINHSFLLILNSKLTRGCYSLEMQMRFLKRLAEKLLFSMELKYPQIVDLYFNH